MAIEQVNLGTEPLGTGGDTARTAFEKVNANFDELDSRVDDALKKSENLGDLQNAAAARVNIGLGNVDNTSDADKPVSNAVQNALDEKAPLDSPELTGTPTAPTPSPGTNGQQIATTAFVASAVDDLIDGAPAGLDTLGGIADALDQKAPSSREIEAGGGLVGGGDLSSDRVISLGTPSTLSKDSTNSVDAETHSHELSDNLKAWDNLDPSSLPPSVAYRQTNILGTVSQAGGVPTGAIIERGSNANGEFIRYADGTQICWNISMQVNYSGAVAMHSEWVYPAAFATRPAVTWTPESSGDGFTTRDLGAARAYTVTETLANLRIQIVAGSNATLNENSNTRGSPVAIGRWYN